MDDDQPDVDYDAVGPHEIDASNGRADDLRHRDEVPDHAHTVLVPIANPDTAVDLLTLAVSFARARRGRVIALSVVVGESDAEDDVDRVSAVQTVVEVFNSRQGDVRVESITRQATSAARGILDVAREDDADLIILGAHVTGDGIADPGRVATNVTKAATSDVLILRPGRHHDADEAPEGPDTRTADEIDADNRRGRTGRVLVAVDGSDASRTAARAGVLIAEGSGRPVEIVHVQQTGEPRHHAVAVLARSLDGVEGRASATTVIVKADDPVTGIVGLIKPDDLLVLGLLRRGADGSSVMGSVVAALLGEVSGPVLTVARTPGQRGLVSSVQRLFRWLRPRLTDTEQETISWRATGLAAASLDFVVLIFVSCIIASFGLLLNSAAVIIGAMLVAPLMSPINSFAVGMVSGELRTARRAFVATIAGIALALLASFLIGIFAGPESPTSEMVSRGSPTLIDAGVALAAGLAGAYATARKDIPAALAGVAIAAALVPPICVTGLAVAMGRQGLAVGAALLFITNIVCIALSASITFVWLGLGVRGSDERERRRYAVLTATAVVAALAAIVAFDIITAPLDPGQLRETIAGSLREQDAPDARPTQVTELEMVRSKPLRVTATVRSVSAPSVAAVAEAQSAVERQVGDEVELIVVHQQIVTAP